MRQWHPLFAQLLQPLLQEYYEIRTNLPVGDLPREADLVLLRRTATSPPPFHGIWQHLSTWNALEYKGPSDDPALRDLDLLVELGLGIDRRLNEDRSREGHSALARGDVSFWYIANHLGRRFLAEANRLFGAARPLAAGLWRCQVLGHAVFLVSSDAAEVDRETVPLHLLCREPEAVKLRLAEVVLGQPGWWDIYGPYLVLFHPQLVQEIERMASTSGVEPILDLTPLVEYMGMPRVVEQLGIKRIIDTVGLRRVLDMFGVKRVVEEIGIERIIEEYLENLTPEEREALKKRL